MKVKRELQRRRFSPIHLCPGDSLRMSYREPEKPEVVLMEEVVTTARTFNEGVIFEGEDGGRYVMGAYAIEEER